MLSPHRRLLGNAVYLSGCLSLRPVARAICKLNIDTGRNRSWRARSHYLELMLLVDVGSHKVDQPGHQSRVFVRPEFHINH